MTEVPMQKTNNLWGLTTHQLLISYGPASSHSAEGYMGVRKSISSIIAGDLSPDQLRESQRTFSTILWLLTISGATARTENGFIFRMRINRRSGINLCH